VIEGEFSLETKKEDGSLLLIFELIL